MQEAIERIRSIDYNSIFDQAIEEKKDLILNLIRLQLLSGEKKDGSPIGTYSDSSISKEYVQLKMDRGLFPINTNGSYNLMFDGTFYQSLVITINGDNIVVESTDSKLGKIEALKGLNGDLGNALELNEEHLGRLREEVLPIIQSKIRGSLGI